MIVATGGFNVCGKVSRSTNQFTRQPLIDVPIRAYNRDIDKRLARKLVCAKCVWL